MIYKFESLASNLPSQVTVTISMTLQNADPINQSISQSMTLDLALTLTLTLNLAMKEEVRLEQLLTFRVSLTLLEQRVNDFNTQTDVTQLLLLSPPKLLLKLFPSPKLIPS